ncbi:sigma factor-like helix-turn-helix DNA-binding protein [Nostocoides japonicum]|uniref:sigma factor-like helix-turn-helix DNA-binding protein n=1 Tax=Nostocoides japonicum TaxID=99481 RepID=UPI00138F19AB
MSPRRPSSWPGASWIRRSSAICRGCTGRGLTLRNSERTERRQRRTAGRLAAEPPLASPDPAGAHAHRSTVLAAVQRLPEADRELLYLVAWEGLDVKSAAAATGRSAGATAVRLHRARARLRHQLGDHPSLPSTVLPEASP